MAETFLRVGRVLSVDLCRSSEADRTFRGIEEALSCSSDPLCIESGGQGAGSLNLAACHGCTLLPETSCEEGNRFLDRATLIGTQDDASLGYFSDMAGDIISGS